MGGAKQKWTAEEEEALRQGVEKHGTGKWKLIQRDPDFNHLLFNRSNVDLKDKWRNLVVGGQVPSSPVPPVPVSNKPKSSSNKPKSTAVSTAAQQTNEHSAMILEAISALQGVDGVDITAIFDFIKPRHEISTSFRKLLCAKLRRLAQLDKIEKVGRQRYKIKRSSSFPTKTPPSVAVKTPPSYVTKTPSSFATKTPTPKQEDPAERPRPVQQSVSSLPAKEDLEQRTTRAIHETMEAEASWFLACDAMKDLKIAEKYLEENQTMLEVARDIYSRCSDGERVFLA